MKLRKQTKAREQEVLPSAAVTYRQCRLARDNARQIAWFPEEFAVVGRFLRLTEAGITEDGWQVISAGSCLTGDYVVLDELGRW